MAWFSKSSERDGLDMCYLMSRYETEASGAMRGSRTSLIFYSGMDSELEALLLSGGASYFRYSDQDCVFTVAGIEDDGDIGSSVKRLRAYAREQGLRLSDELYSIT